MAAPTAKPKAKKPRPPVAAALARGRAAGKQAYEEGNVSSSDDEPEPVSDDDGGSEPAVPPPPVAAVAGVPVPPLPVAAAAGVPDEATLLDPDHLDLSHVHRMFREFVVEWTREKPFVKRGEPKTQKVQMSTVSLTFLQDLSF
jgi:hypothetical protein